jgi:hypothetical protein
VILGSIAVNQVAVGSAVNTIAGDPDFLFNGSELSLGDGANGAAALENTGQLYSQIASQASDANLHLINVAGAGDVEAKLLNNDKLAWTGGAGYTFDTAITTGALTYPTADSTSGYVVTTNGSGVLSLQPVTGDDTLAWLGL